MPAERSILHEDGLAVVEGETAFYVVWENAPDDWLACFDKSHGFPARAWAENMVRVYNRRFSGQDDASLKPPSVQSASAHPSWPGTGRRGSR